MITVRYRNVTALDRLSLHVLEGERLALLGANGSGKSTLLRVLNGLTFPESGAVEFEGEELTEDRLADREFAFRFRRRVGLVFQNPDVQLFNPTVFDEVAFGPLQLRWPKEQIRQRVYETLQLMGIASLRDRSPHQLSGGERKRVALASIAILDPAVLLLDEPAGALDPESQSQIVEQIHSWRGGRKTVVTATHDLGSLEEIADRCVVFEKGRLIGDGTPMEILHDVPLLRRARVLSVQAHAHPDGASTPHPHLHR
jgi:cobalt/nickel transport system ATP-binding protein